MRQRSNAGQTFLSALALGLTTALLAVTLVLTAGPGTPTTGRATPDTWSRPELRLASPDCTASLRCAVVLARDLIVENFVDDLDGVALLREAAAASLDHVREKGRLRYPSSRTVPPDSEDEGAWQRFFDDVEDFATARGVRRADLVAVAIAAMARSVHDGHTVFFPNSTVQPLGSSQESRLLRGLGVSVWAAAGSVVVRSVAPDGPAGVAGIRVGDTITSIGGKAVNSESMYYSAWPDAAKSARGPVLFEVLRGSSMVTLRVSVPTDRVIGWLTEARPGISHIVIPTFALDPRDFYLWLTATLNPGFFDSILNRSSPSDLPDAVSSPVSKGRIIDLRGNGGGYSDGAASLAAAFGFEGDFMALQTRKSQPNAYQVYPVGNSFYSEMRRAFRVPDPPRPARVVLVDERTASAAEMAAAALQEAGARVIGRTTVGQTNVPEEFAIAGGVLWVGSYRTFVGNSKRNLQGVGLTPDEVVELDIEKLKTGVDTQLEAAIRWLESQQ